MNKIILSTMLFAAVTLSACLSTAPNVDNAASNKTLQNTEYTFEAANYWGKEIEVVDNITDEQECARLCLANSSCKIATYSDETAGGRWSNTCTLRHGKGPRHTEQVGIYSWIKP